MFTITTGGCRTDHPAPFTLKRPYGIPEHLLLFVHTKAEYDINGSIFSAACGEMVLVEANTPYTYHSLESHYMDDWFHFLCSSKELHQIKDLFHKPISFANPSRVSNYLPQLLWEYNEDYQQNCHLILKLLLDHAKRAVENKKNGSAYSPYLARLQELRLKLLSDPTEPVNVADISRGLGISISYFEHLYSDFFNISFRNDLINIRINYAKELISGTQETIASIAELCGYQNEVHFYRQFKKNTGLTPATYRRLTIEGAPSPAKAQNRLK